MVFGLQDTRFGLLLQLLTKGSNVSLLKTSMYITWMNSVPPNCIGKPNKKETIYGYQIEMEDWERYMQSKHLLWWKIEIHWDASTEIETLVWICGNLLHTIWIRVSGCQPIRDQENRFDCQPIRNQEIPTFLIRLIRSGDASKRVLGTYWDVNRIILFECFCLGTVKSVSCL